MDRHRIWRAVAYDYEQIAKAAPSGYELRIEVYITGRPLPVEPAYVETSRSENSPWVRMQTRSHVQDEEERAPDELWVHVREERIERVELRFVPLPATLPKPHPVGFSYREVEEQ